MAQGKLTKEQVKEYRKKLNDAGYMEAAVNGAADKISQWITSVKMPDVKPEINISEGTMKNRANDLHNILFEQLERLNDLDEEEMKSEKLLNEFKRAEAITKVSAQLNNNRRLVLDAMKFSAAAPEKVELTDMFCAKAAKALLAPEKTERALLSPRQK